MREFGEHEIDKISCSQIFPCWTSTQGPEGPERLNGSMVGCSLPTRQLICPSKKLLLTLSLYPTALQGPLELPGHLCHESVARGEAEGDGGLG